MMTKTAHADLLLDAIGYIGEDIVAEASGMSSVLTVPSKLKLNLMVMRKLLVATVCFAIISAMIPLSVHLYNNYIVPAFAPSDTVDTSEEDTVTELDPSISDTDTNNLSIPAGYALDQYVVFEMTSFKGAEKENVSVSAFTLSDTTDGSRALFLEVRSVDGNELYDSALFNGHCIVIGNTPSLNELIVFNTSLNSGSNVLGQADLAKYHIQDRKITKSEWIGILHADFDISSEESVTDSRLRVFNLFMTLSHELDGHPNMILIIDTYSSDEDIIFHPDEKAAAPDIPNDRKEGKRTWSIERICELFNYSHAETSHANP